MSKDNEIKGPGDLQPGDCQHSGYNYEDGSSREHSEMIKAMDAYEKEAKIRLDATVKVFDSQKYDQGFLVSLIPQDKWFPRFNYDEVLEVIKTLEATLETIEIMDGFQRPSGFAAWSQRHAA